jgi:hypothetical protein
MECSAYRRRRRINQLLITHSAFFSYWRKVEQWNSISAIYSSREIMFVDVSSRLHACIFFKPLGGGDVHQAS